MDVELLVDVLVVGLHGRDGNAHFVCNFTNLFAFYQVDKHFFFALREIKCFAHAMAFFLYTSAFAGADLIGVDVSKCCAPIGSETGFGEKYLSSHDNKLQLLPL